MSISRVHHLNFLVRDLDAAIARYEAVLGLPVARVDALPERGVRTARFRAGETWIVLVQPVAEGEPMRLLERNGEGFFLVSYEVDDLRAAVAQAATAGVPSISGAPRRGLDGWRVVDLDPSAMHGVLVQFCEEERS